MPTAIANPLAVSSHNTPLETSSRESRPDDLGTVELLPRRRWNRAEYHAMGDAGIFGEWERVELIEGEIIAVSPKSLSHTVATTRIFRILRGIFEPIDCAVRKDDPVILQDDTEPEPDVAVARAPASTYDARQPGPADLILVVEVSLATIRGDRAQKGRTYARAGVPEYWLVNLPERLIEVYRDPGMIGTEFGYRSATLVTEDQTVSPIDVPDAGIPVRDLLP